LVYQWEGEDTRKGGRRMNMVEILCMKWKMRPVEKGIKENGG
jgi:hypothetical protein